MKNYIFLITAILLFSVQLKAQKDTVFVDANDSSKIYQSMPNGFSPLDTNDKIANRMALKMSYHGMNNHPNAGWNGVIPEKKVDTLQNLFVHWSFKSSHGISNGTLYFRKDGIILDSLQLTNDSIPVYYADTFPTTSFDSIQYKDHAYGLDSVEFVLGYFQIRTEIRISLTTSLNELAFKEVSPSIYPNPSQSTISFKHFNKIQSEPYKIISISGNIIKSGVMDDNLINISNLKSGTYLFQIPRKQIVLKFQKLSQ